MWPTVFSDCCALVEFDDLRSCALPSRGRCILRAANSSSPDRPSRRSSSASTSAGLQAERRQRDHGVEPQVGHLGDDLLAVAVLGRHHDLGRFLADLLQDRVGALGEQARDVALVAGRRRGAARSRRPAAPGCRCCSQCSSVDALRVFQDRLDGVPRAVLVALEEARVAAGVAGDAGLVAELRHLEQHARRCRSRGGSRAPAGCGRTPRPCATGAGASGSSTPPRRARPSAPAPRGS